MGFFLKNTKINDALLPPLPALDLPAYLNLADGLGVMMRKASFLCKKK